MSLKTFVSYLTLFWTILFVPIWANSQVSVENQLTKAIQTFDKGNYTEAEPMFRSLLKERPDDFMINYFYGACRTENGHYSANELNYLKKASQEVSPLDIDYYLGVQYQAQENWEQALKHYNKYGKIANPKELERVSLTEKIQQCYDKINPFPVEELEEDVTTPIVTTGEESLIVSGELIDSQNSLEILGDSLQQNQVYVNESIDSLVVEKETSAPVEILPTTEEEHISFNINSEITYHFQSQFKTKEGKELFVSARDKQNDLDQIMQELDFLRDKYAQTYNRNQKDSIGQKILEYENNSYDLKNEINNMQIRSKSLENEYWQNASDQEINDFILNSKKITEAKITHNKVEITVQNDSSEATIPEILVENMDSPGTTQNPGNTSELIYKIQIGAYSRGIPSYKKSLFNKISLIRKVDNYTDEKGVVVYTTGNLTNFEDALVLQKQVRQEGVEDAFIVPYLNGKRITLEQAKEIEGIK